MTQLAKSWGHIIIALAVIGTVGALVGLGNVPSSTGLYVIVGIAALGLGLHPTLASLMPVATKPTP